MDRKFDWLLKKQNKLIISNIRPIDYYCSIRNDQQNSLPRRSLRINYNCLKKHSVSSTFSFKPILSTPNIISYSINLRPFCFTTSSLSSLNIRDNWLKNLSSTHIPPKVQGILQLGDNFCMPATNKEKRSLSSLKARSLV